MSKRDEPKKLGKNGVDMGDRGVYDKRNTLNDLTGKEWVFFTNSVWITGYSPTAKENVGLKYRKIHPSPKPPALMKEIICYILHFNGVHQRCKNSIVTRILERFQPLFFLLCKLLFSSQIFSKKYLVAVCLECRSCGKCLKYSLFSMFWTVK